MKELILALVGPIVELVIEGLKDEYDPEEERQALLKIARAVQDERMRRLLTKK